MPIFKGDNWQHLYKGDGHPAALYKGSKKLAGWTEESQAGVSHAYFDDTYNDKADVTIHGKSTQVVTTGAQLWQNPGEGTVSGVTLTQLEDGWINLNGTCTQSNNFIVFSRSLETGEYTLSIEKIGSFPDDYNSLAQVYSNETGKNISIANNSSVLFASSQLTGANDYQYRIRIEEGFSYNNAKVRVMFQKGNEVTPWEPYTGGAPSPSPDYPQEIKSVGDSGSVEVVSMGENLYTGGDLYNVTGTESKTFLTPGTEMMLDAICDNVSGSVKVYMTAVYYDKDSNKLGTNGLALKIEGENIPYNFKMTGLYGAGIGEHVDMSNVRKVRLDIKNYMGYDGVFNVRNIMIQPLIPDKPLNNFSGYEQQPSTATFSTPNGLPGIPVDSGGNYTDEDGQQWICDEIDTKKGVYRQNVKKVTYTGDNDEYWTRYDVTQYAGFFTDAADRKIASFNPGFSNRFPIDLNITNKRPGIWLGSTVSTNSSTRIYFHNCNPSIASSLEEWRTWLSTHPVTLIYPLATPVETPLSDAVDTFLGGTNLFVSEHEMDVTVKTEDQANPTGA